MTKSTATKPSFSDGLSNTESFPAEKSTSDDPNTIVSTIKLQTISDTDVIAITDESSAPNDSTETRNDYNQTSTIANTESQESGEATSKDETSTIANTESQDSGEATSTGETSSTAEIKLHDSDEGASTGETSTIANTESQDSGGAKSSGETSTIAEVVVNGATETNDPTETSTNGETGKENAVGIVTDSVTTFSTEGSEVATTAEPESSNELN